MYLWYFLHLFCSMCLRLVLFLSSVVAASQWTLIPKTDVPDSFITRVGNCGDDKGTPCNITFLAEQCTATPSCVAFNTNGFLKQCASCEFGSACCTDTCQVADLYVRQNPPAPSDWNSGILYSPRESLCFAPEVGNGYLASVIGWASTHVAGFYHASCGNGVHRARLPSPIAGISPSGVQLTAAGLDTYNGVYLRRFNIGSAAVEQKIYAHRTLMHVLVTHFSLVSGDTATFNITTLFDPLTQQNDQGNNCAGAFSSNDLNFVQVPAQNASAYSGQMSALDDANIRQNASIAVSKLPSIISLSSSTPEVVYLAAIATTIDVDTHTLTASNTTARALYYLQEAAKLSPADLYQNHTQAWNTLWSSRIQVEFNSEYGRQIATHANSSLYYLYSSIRSDHCLGSLSPGGLATENYQGAIFMDADVYMLPSLVPHAPELAKCHAQYRINGLEAAAKLAKLAGYDRNETQAPAIMYPWTAQANGNAFSCCTMHGSYENCLEQHITPDVSVSFKQFFSMTWDFAWLKQALPVLEGVANFIINRVALGADGLYHINYVLPIDEWCDNAVTSCLTKGINDSAQMNGFSKVALRWAADAYDLLNMTDPQQELWRAVADKLPVLFDEKNQRHIQFEGFTPNLPERSYICPEEVLYLTHPVGPSLNISAQVTANDAEFYIPITCKETRE
eukprot:m.61668 g.61668  ORF g.61668 m.61668 type:complete len:678 (+) comp19291_c0_seq2:45-2078(+)